MRRCATEWCFSGMPAPPHGLSTSSCGTPTRAPCSSATGSTFRRSSLSSRRLSRASRVLRRITPGLELHSLRLELRDLARPEHQLDLHLGARRDAANAGDVVALAA